MQCILLLMAYLFFLLKFFLEKFAIFIVILSFFRIVEMKEKKQQLWTTLIHLCVNQKNIYMYYYYLKNIVQKRLISISYVLGGCL